MPELENVMYNYMKCNYMMIGPKVRYSVTYKYGAKGFNIFRAKYIHNFKVCVESRNLEGSKVIELNSINSFVCTRTDGAFIYDSRTFKQTG